jgi:hypothetical protein
MHPQTGIANEVVVVVGDLEVVGRDVIRQVTYRGQRQPSISSLNLLADLQLTGRFPDAFAGVKWMLQP